VKKTSAASIRARLLNLSKKEKIDFSKMLILYAQERLLYRLSRSSYRKRFLLKGGLLIYAEYRGKARPTKDIDLGAEGIPSVKAGISTVFRDILSIDSEDGLKFYPESLMTQKLAGQTENEGLRITVDCSLEQARMKVKVDLGFGDVVRPRPIQVEYPRLLDEEPIIIQAYSWETVIAEKFHAIAVYKETGSRMKDFYDIWLLLNNRSFHGFELCDAISATFSNRETKIEEADDVFTDEFITNQQKEIQWRAFLGKSELKSTCTFSEIMADIRQFILPVLDALRSGKDFHRQWSYGGTWIVLK
jgi:predicted nucleotidyltransferase component of viral defense system